MRKVVAYKNKGRKNDIGLKRIDVKISTEHLLYNSIEASNLAYSLSYSLKLKSISSLYFDFYSYVSKSFIWHEALEGLEMLWHAFLFIPSLTSIDVCGYDWETKVVIIFTN